MPEIPADLVATELPRRLLELWPKFLSFFISFWIVGLNWTAHHRIFHYIRGYDRRLLLINLLFLMWVALMPFLGSLLGEYGGQQLSVVFYAGHMIVVSLTLSWLWRHASRDQRLVDPSLDPDARRYTDLRVLAVPFVFLLSIAISFVNVNAAEYSWLLLFLVRPVLLRYMERDRRS